MSDQFEDKAMPSPSPSPQPPTSPVRPPSPPVQELSMDEV